MGRKNLKIKDFIIDHHKYLGKGKNSLKIYGYPPNNLFLSPFKMDFDTIDRLLTVNFEDDPIYFRIELQIFHQLDKEYPIVFMYRKDDMIDIYYTNEYVIKKREKIISDLLINISFNQLEEIDYKFQFDEMGLKAYLLLNDKLEKQIEFNIEEKIPRKELAKIHFNPILIPIGAISKKPKRLPIIFLDKFGMVVRKNTEISVKIHGVLRSTSEMPYKINGMIFYQAHYSLDPITCSWNSFSGNLDPIIINTLAQNITSNNLTYNLFRNSDYYEIKKVSGKDEKDHVISFEFSPPIPNLLFISNNSKIKGKLSCVIDESKGIFIGIFNLTRTGENIEFSITPTKGWQPLWFKNYKWSAEIQIEKDGNYKISSYWRRITG